MPESLLPDEQVKKRMREVILRWIGERANISEPSPKAVPEAMQKRTEDPAPTSNVPHVLAKPTTSTQKLPTSILRENPPLSGKLPAKQRGRKVTPKLLATHDTIALPPGQR